MADKTEKKPTRFIVTTPKNPQYRGKAAGVTFTNGKALVEENTIDTTLGRTPEEIADLLKKDFNYEVNPIA